MRFKEREDVPWAKARGTQKRTRNKNYGKINRSIQGKKRRQREVFRKEYSSEGYNDAEGYNDVESYSYETEDRFEDTEKEYVSREWNEDVKENTPKRTQSKSAGVYSMTVHFTKKIVQRVQREFVETAQQQNGEEGKRSHTKISVFTIISSLFTKNIKYKMFIGGAVALLGVFFTTIPIIILAFLISTNVEKQIVETAQQEYYIFDQNIGGQKYKDWYGLNGDWCAMFVSFCSEQCGYINDGFMPRTASVAAMASWYQERDEFVYAYTGYEPRPGDIIFFQEGMSHVGIVISYDSQTKTIYTIEGNTGASETEIYHEGSQVMLRWYPLTYPKITGYAKPDYPIDYSLDREIVMYFEDKNERRLCA